MTTEHFKDSEWSHPQWDPYPEEWLPRLHRIQLRLEMIRAQWGKPMPVTPNGGYRSPRHNRAIGGSPASLHMQGLATDIAVPGGPREVLRFRRLVLALDRSGDLADLSGVGAYPTKGFVHLDFFGPKRRDGSPRRWWGLAWRRRR